MSRLHQKSEFEPRLHSLIIPVYSNEGNIPSLVEALEKLAAKHQAFEVVFVIDGSPDSSGPLLLSMQETLPFRSSVISHSRNFGSFVAIRTGMEFARGEYIAVMAADLQEPPELVETMFKRLGTNECDIVFGQRSGREDSFAKRLLSNIFWWFYRKFVIKDVPPGGVDIFACNRKVLDSLMVMNEKNSALIAQLFWVGFRRSFVPYRRRKRKVGKSAWGLKRRFRYMTDSIFAFSDFPIYVVLWIGFIGCLTSMLFALIVAISRILGVVTIPGYAATVVLLAFGLSSILLVQGMIGLYVWRAYENTKDRPIRLVSDVSSYGFSGNLDHE